MASNARHAVVRSTGATTWTRKEKDEWRRSQAAEELGRILSDGSGKAAAAVQTAGAEVQDVQIMPWHRSLQRARDAYLEHNDAWVSDLRAVAAEPSEWGDNALRSEIAATFRIADRRVSEALPVLPMNDAAECVRDIFAD